MSDKLKNKSDGQDKLLKRPLFRSGLFLILSDCATAIEVKQRINMFWKTTAAELNSATDFSTRLAEMLYGAF